MAIDTPPVFRNRASSERSALAPEERVVCWILAANLVFLPWPLASNRAIPQVLSLALAIAGFVSAISFRVPSSSGSQDASPLSRLLRWPLFWLGAGLLAYLTIQAENFSWKYATDGHRWWLVRQQNVGWLPTSVAAPFSQSNCWRELIVYADVWMVGCSIWVGLTRRKSLRTLLYSIVAGALTLACVLFLQRTVMGSHFPWPLSRWTEYELTASFIGRNQAGAYFDLTVFCAAALALWHYEHALRISRRSSPSGVMAICAVIIAGAVLYTFSRGAVLVLAMAACCYCGWVLMRMRRSSKAATNRRILIVLAALFAVFVAVAIRDLDFSELASRFGALATERTNEPNVRSRLIVRRAALALLRAHGWRGVGAGAFQYVFPDYIRSYPEVYGGGRLFWEHAHDDWLEFPIELGVIGDLLLFGIAAWTIRQTFRRRFWRNAVGGSLLIGCSQTLLHAWFDFPFQSPSIMVTWWTLLVLAIRWAELSPVEKLSEP